MKSVLNNEDYYKFYYYTFWGNDRDIYVVAIRKAYRDFNRTLTGFSKCENKEEVFNKSVETLRELLIGIESSKISTQQEFDIWHKSCCDKLIECFKNKHNFTYGQAQKWINMSLKYLSMENIQKYQSVYKFFHIPIDNIILKTTEYKFDTAWSRITDYKKYLEFQYWFRNKYEGIPLDNEFNLWLNNLN